MKTAVLIGLSRHRINVDGAGVTTLVAFHGCPLNCKYCLNPQALSPKGVWKRFSPEELFRAVSKDDGVSKMSGGIFSEALWGVLYLRLSSLWKKYKKSNNAITYKTTSGVEQERVDEQLHFCSSCQQ